MTGPQDSVNRRLIANYVHVDADTVPFLKLIAYLAQ